MPRDSNSRYNSAASRSTRVPSTARPMSEMRLPSRASRSADQGSDMRGEEARGVPLGSGMRWSASLRHAHCLWRSFLCRRRGRLGAGCFAEHAHDAVFHPRMLALQDLLRNFIHRTVIAAVEVIE